MISPDLHVPHVFFAVIFPDQISVFCIYADYCFFDETDNDLFVSSVNYDGRAVGIFITKVFCDPDGGTGVFIKCNERCVISAGRTDYFVSFDKKRFGTAPSAG